ncbi:hypothetical protein OSG_eHP30_00075 [environmental Halophage eHP-30]|nr:hypothetical protein OSG_eHP30_00075 [environmental Halophage eHP-30]
MALYRKKPTEIDAIELGKDPIPKTVSYTIENGSYKIYNKLHNSMIEAKLGDMIRIDQAPEDVYPIDRQTFEQTYEKVE